MFVVLSQQLDSSLCDVVDNAIVFTLRFLAFGFLFVQEAGLLYALLFILPMLAIYM